MLRSFLLICLVISRLTGFAQSYRPLSTTATKSPQVQMELANSAFLSSLLSSSGI